MEALLVGFLILAVLFSAMWFMAILIDKYPGILLIIIFILLCFFVGKMAGH